MYYIRKCKDDVLLEDKSALQLFYVAYNIVYTSGSQTFMTIAPLKNSLCFFPVSLIST